jgi:hydroxymethylbilane synthase
VGQGALAVEFLEANRDLYRFLDGLEHRETVLAVSAERAVMRTLHGGCRLPLGAYARFEGESLVIDACVFSEDGAQAVRARGAGSFTNPNDAWDLGCRVASEMLANGADKVLAATARAQVR